MIKQIWTDARGKSLIGFVKFRQLNFDTATHDQIFSFPYKYFFSIVGLGLFRNMTRKYKMQNE